MNTETIGALGLQDEVAAPAGWRAQGLAAAKGGFLEQVNDGLREVNAQLLTSQADLQGLALGDTESLHAIMIHLEESRIALQLTLQVRNRVLEAYQDVMRMQV